jgi:DHA1 family inner membrane transport protein
MAFLVNLSRVIFAPLVQPVAADLDVTAASLGVVASAAWVGSAAPRLPTGYLLTRFPRHQLVGATGAVLVVTSAATGLATSVAWLTVGAFLMGVSSGIYFIAANPLLSELFPERVGRALGTHGMFNQFAAVGAPLFIGGLLVVGGWQSIFFCISGLAAVTTLVLVWAARRTSLPGAGAADRSMLAATRAQWPILLTGVVFLGFAGFLWNGLFNLYGDYLTVAKGIDPGTGRLLLSLTFAAGVPAFFLTGRLADRVPSVPLLLSIVTVFVACVLALTVVQWVVLVAAVSAVLGYVIHSIFPVVDTYLLASLPDHHRGSAYAVYSAVVMLVQSLGSGAVGTAVTRGVSYTTAFRALAVVVGGVIVVLAGLYVAGRLPAGGAPPDASVSGESSVSETHR